MLLFKWNLQTLEIGSYFSILPISNFFILRNELLYITHAFY